MGKISIDFKTGSIKSKTEIAVGIDLGTTNSLIAYVDQGTAKIINVGKEGSNLIPSVIHIDDTGKISIGENAKAIDNHLFSIKRFIGKTRSDLNADLQMYNYQIADSNEDELISFKLNDKNYSAIELSAEILKELKHRAEEKLKHEIKKAVITVPAYFTDAQRQATREAGNLAGLDVLRIINEPTAASMAYGLGLDPKLSKHVMVYDFGGGTFDASILRIENGVFEVLATQGDNFLGGDDIDQAIINYWKKLYNLEILKSDEIKFRQLAELTKKELSLKNESRHVYNNIHISLDRKQLDELCHSIIDRTIVCCKQVIRDSKIQIKLLDEIILVGGSTRLLKVKEKLREEFQKPLNDSLNPDEVVALGAAVQADILMGNRTDLLLLDVCPLSLGIETIGGLMDTIVPRNSKIPLQLAKQYTTSKDGQKKLKISIYQGERELVTDNIKLAEFILSDIPPMPAGLPKIEMQFKIDADGILSVSAKELRSGVLQQIEIRSAFKLNEQEILQRLNESTIFAKADMEKRSYIEVLNEGNYIIENAKKFLNQNNNILSSEEKIAVEHSISFLENSLANHSTKEIEKAIQIFNNDTATIAHKMMDEQLKKSLEGNTIEDIV